MEKNEIDLNYNIKRIKCTDCTYYILNAYMYMCAHLKKEEKKVDVVWAFAAKKKLQYVN